MLVVLSLRRRIARATHHSTIASISWACYKSQSTHRRPKRSDWIYCASLLAPCQGTRRPRSPSPARDRSGRACNWLGQTGRRLLVDSQKWQCISSTCLCSFVRSLFHDGDGGRLRFLPSEKVDTYTAVAELARRWSRSATWYSESHTFNRLPNTFWRNPRALDASLRASSSRSCCLLILARRTMSLLKLSVRPVHGLFKGYITPKSADCQSSRMCRQ